MILADPINCTIPSVDALKIKGQEITCTTSLIDSAKGVELMWISIGAVGAFGAMLITVFMARYAWKAWQSALAQNANTLVQIELTRELAIEAQRVPALTDFIHILRSLCLYLHELNPTHHTKLVPELEHAAVRWMLTYPESMRKRSLEVLSVRVGTALSVFMRLELMSKTEARLGNSVGEAMLREIHESAGDFIREFCEEVVHEAMNLHLRVSDSKGFEEAINNLSTRLLEEMESWDKQLDA